MEDFGMRKISAKMVPQTLIDDNKKCQIHISSDLLHNAKMFDRVLALLKIKKCSEGTKVC
jgi:predicted nicotinamide N-methyase